MKFVGGHFCEKSTESKKQCCRATRRVWRTIPACTFLDKSCQQQIYSNAAHFLYTFQYISLFALSVPHVYTPICTLLVQLGIRCFTAACACFSFTVRNRCLVHIQSSKARGEILETLAVILVDSIYVLTHINSIYHGVR